MKKPRLDRGWMKLECGNEKGPPKRAFELIYLCHGLKAPSFVGVHHVVTLPFAWQ